MEERVLNRAYGFRERQSVPELRKDVEKKYPYQSFLPSYNLLLLPSIGWIQTEAKSQETPGNAVHRGPLYRTQNKQKKRIAENQCMGKQEVTNGD